MKNGFNQVFVKVAGVFVALDMPDPRTDGKEMLWNILGAAIVVLLSLIVIFVLGDLQGAPE